MLDGIITKGVGGLYVVSTPDGVYECSALGIFRNKNITPTIGDYVTVTVIDESKKKGTVSAIKERKNQLIRPRVCNVDKAVLVFAAASPELNVDLLDRLIILCENERIDVVVCINKMDLADEPEIIRLKDLYERIGYRVVLTSSALRAENPDALAEVFRDSVTVLAGPSGVGKSSIINAAVPHANMQMGTLSRKIDRGKHTTRHVELLQGDGNCFIVDTPGFSSLLLNHIDKKDFAYLFREFLPFLNECRFNDCMHVKETDCAVKNNVGVTIDRDRYERYVKLVLSDSNF